MQEIKVLTGLQEFVFLLSTVSSVSSALAEVVSLH